jgi:hypothetical protein
MPTLVDEPVSRPNTSPAERLRTTMAAVRVAFSWLGVRKTLSPSQKAEAAATFDAEGNYFSAGKKLLDTSHPAFKAVTAMRGRMIAFWRGISLPFPDPGIRLIRQEDIAMFDVQFTTLKTDLAETVAKRLVAVIVGCYTRDYFPESGTQVFERSYCKKLSGLS